MITNQKILNKNKLIASAAKVGLRCFIVMMSSALPLFEFFTRTNSMHAKA